MPRRRLIPQRKRIIAVAEGDGDRSLAQWLQALCDEHGLHLHLDIDIAGGGDTRGVVEHAVRLRRRRADSRGRDKGAFVLLDADRIAADRANGRDPETVKGRGDLQLVYLTPNLEGLLVRLHDGYAARILTPNNAKQTLKQLWPTYEKPESAVTLGKRFGLVNLLRAAAHDDDLRDVLILLGLMSRRNRL